MKVKICDAEEKGKDCRTASLEKIKKDGIYYTDDILASNRIKGNFSVTRRVKVMQIKYSLICKLGSWKLRLFLFYVIYFLYSISTESERKEWLLEI